LRDAVVRVERGTTLCLVGPNGAGKTTLLKLVATLLHPSSGDAYVMGHSLKREPDEIRKLTGLLTARGFLYDDLSAAENLHFTMRMAGLRPRNEEIARVLERIGLAEVADNRMRTFSTGMRKRLALGQLLVRPIQVALLDEPYAGLDSQGMSLVDEIVREFKAAGTTVLLASHQDGAAIREAEQTGVLRKGHLEILPESEPLSRHLSLGGPAGVPEVE
jgi:ABC-type multidrug transport system ATPase subunit